jgi:Na+/H+-dicarboxylate symporter
VCYGRLAVTGTIYLLLGLAAGLGLGVALKPGAERDLLLDAIEPLGEMWLNGLRLSVIPLVVSCLVVSVGSSHDSAALGRIGRRAVALFAILLSAASLFSFAVAGFVLNHLPIDVVAAAALRQSAMGTPVVDSAVAIGLGGWLRDLVPANPVKAAADGAMLPLIVFALLLGLAIRRVGEEPCQAVLGFFQGLAEAMFVLVRWVLALAPIGAFALAVPLAAHLGVTLAGAVLYYIALVVSLTILFGLIVLYPLATLGGRVPLRRFVLGTVHAQVVAFSSRSSLASIPAMIEGARNTLCLGEEVTVFLVPLAGSVFRVGSAIAQTVGVLFIARLYDIPIAGALIATVVLAVVLTTLSVPGVPGGSIIAIGPVLLAAGLPLAGVGILLALDPIPDLFRTAANVTGGMAAAAVIGRRQPTGPGPSPRLEPIVAPNV